MSAIPETCTSLTYTTHYKVDRNKSHVSDYSAMALLSKIKIKTLYEHLNSSLIGKVVVSSKFILHGLTFSLRAILIDFLGTGRLLYFLIESKLKILNCYRYFTTKCPV